MTTFRPPDRVSIPRLGTDVFGSIRFVGPARFLGGAIEVFLGIELDVPPVLPPQSLSSLGFIQGERGDGMVGGMRYFMCEERKALFVRRDDVGAVIGTNDEDSQREEAAVTIQTAFRRWIAYRLVRAKLASKTWNMLDAHVEEMGIRRGNAVARAHQQLSSQRDKTKIQIDEFQAGEDESEEELAARVMALAEREVSELTIDILGTIRTAPEYDGPNLRFPLSLDTVKAMMEDFRAGKIIHYRYLMSLLLLARQIFSEEATVQEIPLGSTKQMTIVGDTHGQLDDLFTIFTLQGLPSPTNLYLFNGDFVDRGTAGCEIIATLCALKILYPNAVFLNRGNHEARAQNAWMGFEEEILAKYTLPETTIPNDRRAALRVHILCEQVFDALPLCAVVHKRVFVCHGGLFRSDGVSLNHLRSISRKREPPLAGRSFEDRIFEDLLWSDPRPTPTYPRALLGRRPSDRGAGCEFGPAVTNAFCATNDVALVVRSHECVPEGFEVLHNGRLITVFSASRYCGTQTNKGAYMVFGESLQPQVHQFYAMTQAAAFITEDERRRALEEDAVFMIVEQICDKKLDLYWYFTKNDVERRGLVSGAEWARALQNVLGLDLPFLHFQSYLIENDSLAEGGGVNYSKFLSRFQVRGREQDARWQDAVVARVCDRLRSRFGIEGDFDSAWRRFDPRGIGRIDFSEFYETLKILDVGLTDQQIYEFMRGLDADQDAHLGMEEFRHKFAPALAPRPQPLAPPLSTPRLTAASSMGEDTMVWRAGVVENVVNVLYQVRMHVRAALRNHFDLDNQGRIPKADFLKGMRALNASLDSPLTNVQIDELANALEDSDGSGLISYRQFFDGLQIHDAAAPSSTSPSSSPVFATAGASLEESRSGSLMRKGSSFYVTQLEREERARARMPSGLRRASSLRLQASATGQLRTSNLGVCSPDSSSSSSPLPRKRPGLETVKDSASEDDDDEENVSSVSAAEDLV